MKKGNASSDLPRPERCPKKGHLTARQHEILRLLAEGFRMKEAAVVLNITPRTVAFHKYRIMRALGLGRTAELVQYAIRSHVISAAPARQR